MTSKLLELRQVEKSFPGVRALKPLDLELSKGEVLGVVGENGAGKSTLIKVLSGVHAQDGGELLWRGEARRFDAPRDAIESGIATIHQELAGFPRLTVAENLLLGESWPRSSWGGVRWNELHRLATRRLREFDIDLPSTRLFGDLTPAQKQEVAVARALGAESRLLILDEPTASLSEREAEDLFLRLERLRDQGVAILYISHRLDEVLRLCDRVAVLRDGNLVAIHSASDVDAPSLVRDMVGRHVEAHRRGSSVSSSGEVRLELDRVSCEGMFADVSLTVRAGEIVGLGGLVGAGRSELARAVFGLYPVDSGTIRLNGRAGQPKSAHDALRRGVVYLPEERKHQSLVLDHSLGRSIRIGFSDLLARFGIVPAQRARKRVDGAIASYGIRATGADQEVGTLSGGNQQKAVLARWLERGPDVLLLDEPTRGVDVGAKAEIHSLIDQLALKGKAILLISSELPELIGMSDRIVVLREGRVAAELTGESIAQEDVLLAASGVSRSPEDSP